MQRYDRPHSARAAHTVPHHAIALEDEEGANGGFPAAAAAWATAVLGALLRRAEDAVHEVAVVRHHYEHA